MKRNRILAIGILAVSAACAAWASPVTEGAELGEWTMDLDAAKTLAAETGKPLLLNFTGSDWCGWCIRMDKQVFSQEPWLAYARENMVLVWIDFPKDKSLVPEELAERNGQLAQEFEVGGFPTYILLDSDGVTRIGEAGASREATPDSFIATLEGLLLSSEKSILAIREKMTAEQAGALDEAQAAKNAAVQKLEEWVQSDPARTDENIALFNEMREEIEQREAAFLDLLRAAR